MGAGYQSHASAAVPPVKGAGTNRRGGYVGPSTGLDMWGQCRNRRD